MTGGAGWELAPRPGASHRIRGRCVGHRIEIDAPSGLVWGLVADFEGWGAWNPLYTWTRGKAEPGRNLHFTVNLEGLKPQKGAAEVRAVRPNELFEYAISSLGGLLRTLRFVEVEEISPTRCAVINGEIMGGLLGAPISRALGDKVGKGLEGMNRSLRDIAERKWSAQSR